MPDDAPILIAGAGIGGLSAALALSGLGGRIEILERREDFEETGAGIQIGPNGMRAIDALGLRDLLEPCVAKPRSVMMFAGRTGRALATVPLGQTVEARYGAPYWVARRSDLHAALRAKVQSFPEISIKTGFDVQDIAQADGMVTVSAADGAALSGTCLIGADGLWSKVARLGVGAPPPRPTRWVAARALVASSRLSAPFRDCVTGLWLGNDGHFVHYPVARGAMINMVAIVDAGRLGEAGGACQPAGWSTPVSNANLTGAFAGWAPDLLDAIETATDWSLWPLYERAQLDRWSAGRLTVLGDAAQPILPFLAQGGVLALESAVALGDAARAAAGDWAAAFMTYERERRPRAERVARASRQNGWIYHLAGPPALARDLVLRLVPELTLLARLDWLYGPVAAPTAAP